MLVVTLYSLSELEGLSVSLDSGVISYRDMNTKKAKKLRQYTRREVRTSIGEGLSVLTEIVRPRPRWIPKRIWIWAYAPLFPKKYRGLIYKYLD